MATEKPEKVTDEVLYIVEGEEFRIDARHSVEDVRQHLRATFPAIGNAQVQKGSKVIRGDDGVERQYDTVEFVKRSGTKGVMPADLPPVLATLTALRVRGITPADQQLLDQLQHGQFTIGQALDHNARRRLLAVPTTEISISGGDLCAKLDRLPPAADDRHPIDW